MAYHEPTDSHWVNDMNWKKRHKNESIFYGHVDANTKDIHVLSRTMKKDGYYFLPNEDVPWSDLGKIKPDMLAEGMPINIFHFE
jgi:hypothetical protein